MLVACRNKIVFQGKPTIETISLCNLQIQEYIRININNFENDQTYTLQSSNDTVINAIKNIKNTDIIDNINGREILRSFDTFHQNDDNIRRALYAILFPILNFKRKNVLLIGGECYLFSVFCNSDNIYCYSDSEKIVKDCKRNSNCIAELIDYSTFEFPKLNISFDLCILNVSKQGLGKHLSQIVLSFNFETYYISCNEKSFLKDNLPHRSRWNFGNLSYFISLYLL